MGILETKNLEIRREDKVILKDINISIKEGEITCILGKNGCGKTTLLKSLCGDLKPQNGEILLRGKNIKKIKPKDFSKEVSYLTQHRNIITDLSVKELVSYGRFTHKKIFEKDNSSHDEIVDWAMKKANIYHMKDRPLISLSGGESQRAWIAMNIAQRPKILILDEPTTFLDISHQLEILSLVKELNETENITVIMVLHDINDAIRYCDNGILIKNGQVYRYGNIKDIINKNSLKEVFNIDVKKVDLSKDNSIYYPLKVENNV